MNTLTEAALTIALAIVGLATVSVIISRNANTSGVIKAASSGLSQTIGAATAPVTGGGGGIQFPTINLSGSGFGS